MSTFACATWRGQLVPWYRGGVELVGSIVAVVVVIAACLGSSVAEAQARDRRGLAADSPFRLQYALDMPLAIAGLGIAIGGTVWQQRLDPLTEAQITSLSPAEVNPLDRVATRLWSIPAQRASGVTLALALAVPATLLGSARVRHDGVRFVVMWAEVYALTQGLTELTKPWATRTRPYMYGDAVSLAEKTSGRLESQGRVSFFSGHSSLSAAFGFYMATMVQVYHPRTRFSRVAWASAALLSVLTASLRVIGGWHFPSDVIVGHVVGAAVGVGVPWLHTLGCSRRQVTLTPSSVGRGRFVLELRGRL